DRREKSNQRIRVGYARVPGVKRAYSNPRVMLRSRNPFLQHPFDENNPSFRSQRSRTVRENQYALVVVPIVNNVFEEEDIRLRYGQEEIAFEHVASRRKPALSYGSLGARHDLGAFQYSSCKR